MPARKDAPDSVRLYLETIGAQQWGRLEEVFAVDVVRVGPYSDVVEGSRNYRDFLERVISQLRDYELQVSRVSALDDVAWVRLSETISNESGERHRTEEALVFDLDAQGKIARVEVYIQSSGFPGAGAGARAE